MPIGDNKCRINRVVPRRKANLRTIRRGGKSPLHVISRGKADDRAGHCERRQRTTGDRDERPRINQEFLLHNSLFSLRFHGSLLQRIVNRNPFGPRRMPSELTVTSQPFAPTTVTDGCPETGPLSNV